MAARVNAGTSPVFAGNRTSGVVHLVGRYRFDVPGWAGRRLYTRSRTLCGLSISKWRVEQDREASCERCLKLASERSEG